MCDKEKNLQVLPFTKEKDAALGFISKLTAYGGGDTPEDICGGFEQALKQDWKSNAKYAVLITDAPCHGKKYHDTGDTYPQGDPQGRDPEKQLIELAEKGINIYGIKINDITNKMYRISAMSISQLLSAPSPSLIWVRALVPSVSTWPIQSQPPSPHQSSTVMCPLSSVPSNK